MYLRDCLLENVGPIETVDLSLPFNEDGSPKPVVLVGRNGSGKSILLSHVVDALIEFAKVAYQDILVGQQSVQSPYFKIVGGTNQRTGADFGIALLQFSDQESSHCYVDKSGTLDYSEYREKLGARVSSITSWQTEGNHKAAPIPEDYARRLFREKSICYFPSARHERPHWLNVSSVNDEPIFYFAENLSDRLYKPVIVESAAQENRQWLMDVMLDSMADIYPYVEQEEQPELRFKILSNTSDVVLLRQSRSNIEAVLKGILQDESTQLRLSYRNISSSRLYVQTSSGYIPSLSHLSSGQANLFNLFATIIRYADRGDLRKSYQLHEIEGVVMVDEIESQAHSDLQYEVLPKLLKMFPKVQFILTSHSPLFLLGMEREYGSEGFEVIDMPGGEKITTERFSEFERSWQVYRQTEAYEKDMNKALRDGTKPLVYMEGETDPIYLRTALELLGRGDLVEALDIEWVGTYGPQGAVNTGKDALNHTNNVLVSNPNLSNRRVLLLYDCDTNKPTEDTGMLSVRIIPSNSANDVANKGIENLLPPELFEYDRERFYRLRERDGDYGAKKKNEEFDKTEFCRYVCDERRNANDFANFQSVIVLLDKWVARHNGEPEA
jgi:hypothetical protein